MAKVSKKQLILKAIKKLGKTATAKEANNYLLQHHGTKVTEAFYYTVRKKLVTAEERPSVKQQRNGVDADGTVALIKSAKELINSFGKEDAKKLIDLL